MRLDQKVAVITGASRGVGEAIARRFASEGAYAVIADLDAERGVLVAADIRAAGGKALFVETDVLSHQACQAAIDAAVQQYGGLHVLVNNAAATLMTMGGQEMPVTEQPVENFDAILSVSVHGTFWCCKAAIPEMIRSGGGSIINISSIAAMQGMPAMPAYSAGKGAVQSLSRQVAVDYGPQGVRSNTIVLGIVANELMSVVVGDPDMRTACRSQQSARLVTNDDVAHAAVFLASDESEVITGSELLVDGGRYSRGSLPADAIRSATAAL